ncbi:ATP-binding cassette domain-containing protein [Crystallibacter degradans]|uniref:ATP-binding cassette domain-containing protein n=1 Tax=Crystallibacter degradans TaxID=2726743 RepID=UPI001476014A|nr:ABC-F family ATP-binding cassette domain-containing protein [Arthrobacter sp. SF27]
MTGHIHLSHLSHGYGGRLLLDNVSLVIPFGEHLAIIGENGAGKSTLLRLLAGLEQPDAGTVAVHGTHGYLGQTLDLPPSSSVGQAIDASLSGLRTMESELRGLEAAMAGGKAQESGRYDELLAAYRLRDGYAADARVDGALNGLGLGHITRDRKIGSLSGGEQGRLALACLLADPAPVLLLDEPTNHLDNSAVEWLEHALAAHPGTVVAVSHDRTFLQRVATTVVEVDADRRTLTRYGNGYTGYLREKAAERQRWAQAYGTWLDAIAAEKAKIARHQEQFDDVPDRPDKDKMAFDFKTSTVESARTSRLRNAQERLRRLQARPVQRPPEPLKLAADFGGTGLTGTMLEASGVVVEGRLQMDGLQLAAGQKLLVSGPNGAGKTTLLDVLAGRLVPDSGTVRRRGRLGYLPQELAPPAHPEHRLLQAFGTGLPGDTEEHAEKLLALGLFRTADFFVPVGALSVGQYRRLALARLLVGHYDVLLFDEPTNHLAPALVGELEEALAAYAGTLVMVSHDRQLGAWFAGRFGGTGPGAELRLVDGRVAPFPVAV